MYRQANVVAQDGLRTILAQGRTACNRIVSNGGGVKRLFCIQHLSQEAKIRSECYRDPLSDPPAPLCGAKPQLRTWASLNFPGRLLGPPGGSWGAPGGLLGGSWGLRGGSWGLLAAPGGLKSRKIVKNSKKHCKIQGFAPKILKINRFGRVRRFKI